MNIEIHSQIVKTDSLFEKVDQIEDFEMKAEWSKYLCVLSSGLLENSVRILLNDYVDNKSAPNISNYVNSKISYITNLKDNKIKSLLGSFNSEWENSYEQQIDDELKDAIDSIVANRHLIAHGGDTGLSFSRMNKYYTNLKKVIKIIQNIIDE